MATIEQVRERQEEIVNRFWSQPLSRNELAQIAQQGVANVLREPQPKQGRGRSRNALPAPSPEVGDFLQRAFGNEAFQGLIVRLAQE
jgi:prophage maintenance system killer protein